MCMGIACSFSLQLLCWWLCITGLAMSSRYLLISTFAGVSAERPDSELWADRFGWQSEPRGCAAEGHGWRRPQRAIREGQGSGCYLNP